MQKDAWEREYRKPTFLTKEMDPQNDVVRFMKYLRKEGGFEYANKTLLDIGCGTGRNTLYAQEIGFNAVGFDISKTAVEHGLSYAQNHGTHLSLSVGSMSKKFPYPDNSFDVLLDITSSNSLSSTERDIYLIESYRVLKVGGFFMIKALCKDGDLNAKELLKKFPADEKDMYVLPGQGIEERVWTKVDFMEYYEKYFEIIFLEKKESYTRMGDRKYKRNFLIAYMKTKKPY